MSNTKIVVIKLKQLIYAAVFGVLAILLIILLVTLVFSGKKGKDSSTTPEDVAKYTAGIYTSVIALNDTTLNLEIVVDKNHINSVRIVNLDESVTTMYPLVEPALTDLAEQLYSDIDLDTIKLSEDRKYTQTLLLDGIKQTLKKAEISSNTK